MCLCLNKSSFAKTDDHFLGLHFSNTYFNKQNKITIVHVYYFPLEIVIIPFLKQGFIGICLNRVKGDMSVWKFQNLR